MDSDKSLLKTDRYRDKSAAMETGNVDIGLLLERFHASFEPVYNMMVNYECAVLEVETKFKVLNNRLSIQGELNPIETIKTRVKRPESILRKLERLGVPFTLESVEENLFDVAGVRVICSFVNDIYRIEECFLAQDDVKLIKRKDYISNPKPSGYRSLHLVVQTPIYTEVGKKEVYVEVQLRTIAMDFWASLEHKLSYKKNLPPEAVKDLTDELKACAEESTRLDIRMQQVKERLVPEDFGFST